MCGIDFASAKARIVAKSIPNGILEHISRPPEPMWLCKNRTAIKISDMSTNHIKNSIEMLFKIVKGTTNAHRAKVLYDRNLHALTRELVKRDEIAKK